METAFGIVFIFSSFLTLLLVCLKLFTDWGVRETEKKFPPLGQFLTADGIRLHYLMRGSGSPVVLIHGGFGSLYDFTYSIFDRLSKNYQVIAFDRPGHGYSARPKNISMTLQDHARFLHDTLTKLGIERPLLVGHSYGGAVSLAYALEYPQELSGIVLLGGYVFPFEGPVNPKYTIPAIPILGEVLVNTVLQPIRFFLGPSKLAEIAFSPNPPPAEYAEMSTALGLRPSHYKANAEDIRNLSPSLRKLSSGYGKIRVPITIITGDRDAVSPPEEHAYRLHETLPASKLIVLENTGHEPAFIKPDEVIREIKFFFSDRTDSR